jgi:protocatechuate 3,4-dioxygenase beta subunit
MDLDRLDDHGDGLAHDLPRMAALIARRQALGWIACGGAAVLLPAASSLRAAEASGRCLAFPWETAGPYPGNGTVRAPGVASNVLGLDGIVRADIRASFIGSDRVAAGVPLDLNLTLVDATGCRPLANHDVYLWQCDAAGLYSLYTAPQESYLRGLQRTDARGIVQFRTIVPGCYDVRYPHIHVQAFPAGATTGRAALLTSQLVIPADMARATYADARAYPGSAGAFERFPIERDAVFRDNSKAQLAAMTLAATGNPSKGYVARATVAIGA